MSDHDTVAGRAGIAGDATGESMAGAGDAGAATGAVTGAARAAGATSGETETARRLRQALDAMAAEVRPRPDAYERALTEWRRRERRRRLVGLLLACLIFAAADGIGVWALNHGAQRHGPPGPVVFDAPAPAIPQAPASPSAQPREPLTP